MRPQSPAGEERTRARRRWHSRLDVDEGQIPPSLPASPRWARRGGYAPHIPFLDPLPCLAPLPAHRCFSEENTAWNGSKNQVNSSPCKKVDYQYIDLLLIYIDSLFIRLPPSAKERSDHPMG